MADEPSNEPESFDVHTIRRLAALMSRHDLSEIDLREGDRRIRITRGAAIVRVADSLRESVGNAARGASGPPSEESTAASSPLAAKPANKLIEIKSELVGTFYSRANPEAESYVKLGGRVTPATVVGLVEAMKLYNDVQAGCSGVITEILVENQQPVEYDQVLFRVDPSA